MKYHGVAMNGSSTGLTLCLAVVFVVLFVTGCLLTPSMLEFRVGWDVIWRLSGDARTPTVALHVLAGFGLLSMLGAIWALHMRSGWRMKRNRVSGAIFFGTWIALTLTGVGILYLGGEENSLWSSIGHTILGLATPVLLTIHIISGLRSQPAAKARRLARTPDRLAAE